MRVYFTGTCCDDCLCFLANGDVPHDRPKIAAEIDAQWPAVDGYHPVAGDDCGFSWRMCDCCNSSDGGNRSDFVVLVADDWKYAA